MIRLLTAVAVLTACFFLFTIEPVSPKNDEKRVESGENFPQKRKISVQNGGKPSLEVVEETSTEPSTEALAEASLPVLDIVYPRSMRKHNIEASFEVDVSIDEKGVYTLLFPQGVRSEFQKAVEDAFKRATLPRNVHFVLPIEFIIKK